LQEVTWEVWICKEMVAQSDYLGIFSPEGVATPKLQLGKHRRKAKCPMPVMGDLLSCIVIHPRIAPVFLFHLGVSELGVSFPIANPKR
jgi:hypothetical protein